MPGQETTNCKKNCNWNSKFINAFLSFLALAGARTRKQHGEQMVQHDPLGKPLFYHFIILGPKVENDKQTERPFVCPTKVWVGQVLGMEVYHGKRESLSRVGYS